MAQHLLQQAGQRALNSAGFSQGCRLIDSVYEKEDQIGEGQYGYVYKARDKFLNTVVALKKIKLDNEREGFPITALREIKILTSTRHKNVVQLIEIVRSKVQRDINSKGSIYMVFEYMDHDLSGMLKLNEMRNTKFSLSEVKQIIVQILRGLHYCHMQQILHRDLKPSNLLVSGEGVVKLADFGLARRFNEEVDQQLTANVITHWYRPPELFLGSEKYGPEIDIWSAGCIFAELLTGKALFQGRENAQTLDFIFQLLGSPSSDVWPKYKNLPLHQFVKPGNYQNRFDQWCQENDIDVLAAELLNKMLKLDPEERISAEKALEHELFSSDPLPCHPSEIPKYLSSHEWVIKSRQRNKGSMNQKERFAHAQQFVKDQQIYSPNTPK